MEKTATVTINVEEIEVVGKPKTKMTVGAHGFIGEGDGGKLLGVMITAYVETAKGLVQKHKEEPCSNPRCHFVEMHTKIIDFIEGVDKEHEMSHNAN